MSHPSAALVPAIFALAEETGASGEACLDAYLVGFEMMARLGEAMNLVHYHKGWHTTLSLGAPGVAAACGRLLGLGEAEMRMALSLSTSMAGGSKRQLGSMAKPLHAGLAAKNGIVAAQLAAAGVTANEEPFEGKWGYLEMTAGPEAAGFIEPLQRLGAPSAMEQYGVWLKFYPCCASTHRPVDAIRALGLRPEKVLGVEALVSEIAAANLRYLVPKDAFEARFSLPYCLAAAIVDGTLTPASFSPQAVDRPAIRALLGKVAMEVDPELRGNVPVTESRERGTVRVRLADGGTVERAVTVPHGHPEDPLTSEELDGKFLACADGTLRAERVGAALEMLHGLGRLDRVDRLTRLLH
jgi:2-methylcitrate dehydratase PrpD